MSQPNKKKHQELDTVFIERLTKLRMDKGVSARDMSLTIGLSESYIHQVESGKILPSMSVFFYICYYLDISPAEFFQSDVYPSAGMIKAINKLQTLDEEKQKHIFAIIDDM